MQYRRLGSTGLDVSVLSFGGSALGGVFYPIDEAEGVRAVHTAFDLGINYVDVSPAYGVTRAEAVLGRALLHVSRDRYTLSTKVGKFGDGEFDFTKAGIMRGIEASLTRLNLDYVDILLLHDVEYYGGRHQAQALSEGLEAITTLKDQGKTRFIGFSAYPVSVFLENLPRLSVDVVLCHNHYTLTDTQLLDLLPMVRERGIGLISASPLASGLLTKRGPSAWHPASPTDKVLLQQAVALCERAGTGLEKLAIQFATSHPEIPTTLVSAASSDIVRSNVAWLEESLDQRLVADVQALLKPLTNRDWDFGNTLVKKSE